MRWFMAGAGFGLEILALVMCMVFLRRPDLWRGRLGPAGLAVWSAGALAVAGFAVYDHDVTLLLGQALAWLIYALLIFKTGR